ncbi:MAG: TadE/TadG family type IV pilus assembly protein [Gaiellaceae bacterium]
MKHPPLTLSRTAALKKEGGQAMTELALVMPIFALLILAIVQFGIAFNNYLTLTDATRAGARKAAVSRFVGDDGASAKLAVENAAAGLDPAKLDPNITVTSTPDWTTTGSQVAVTASYPYSINIFGFVVKAGNLTSTTKESLE